MRERQDWKIDRWLFFVLHIFLRRFLIQRDDFCILHRLLQAQVQFGTTHLEVFFRNQSPVMNYTAAT